MHKVILTEKQIELLPLVKKFRENFILVGGTAIALQIGHRRSIDFDMFSFQEFNNLKIRKTIIKNGYKIGKVYKDEEGQFTFFIDNVQFTFFHYPFKIDFPEKLENILQMPDLLTLAAMKAYALGRRAKWKDYVDLYFILQEYQFKEIVNKAKRIFKGQFNEKLFREQLSYFEDINYTEPIEYLSGKAVADEVIKEKLKEIAVS